jgi:hypothetical protein
MAYTDHRRATFATLAAMRHFTQTWDDTNIRVWLWPNPTTGAPEVTRRVAGLRQYRLCGSRVSSDVSPAWNVERFPDVAARIGLRVWTVEDVVTGQRFDLPPMGNGTTVWVTHPNGEH